MRKFLLMMLLGIYSIVAFSQYDTGQLKESLKQSSTQNDSAIGKLQQVTDSPAKSIEIKQWEERNIKAMLQVSELVKERRAKEKRNAYLRIGFGVALLVVLIVGLMRRKVKK